MTALVIFVIGVLVGMALQRSRVAAASAGPAPMRDVTDHEIEELLRGGDRIGAIRRYREIHRCDIATAERLVNLLEQTLRRAR